MKNELVKFKFSVTMPGYRQWVGRVKRIKQVKLKTRPKLKILAEFIRDGKFYKTVSLRSGAVITVEMQTVHDETLFIVDDLGMSDKDFNIEVLKALVQPISASWKKRILAAHSTPTFLPGPKVTFWHEEKQMFVIDTLDNYVAFKDAEKLERTKKRFY